MKEEKIIRDEAISYFIRKLKRNSGNVVEKFHALKSRLMDFYSAEYKALFLDEIEKKILEDLSNHRDQAHGGIPSPSCQYEISAEKFLFYIEQEIQTFPHIARHKEVLNPKFVRSKVFVSYSHHDKEYLKDLQRHFKPFLDKIDFWDDSKILPGQVWENEITNAINETKVAILLLSTDFLGSDFIANNELPPLLKAADDDGAVILVVILKPCLFDEFPKLNQYQAMNPPSNPISKMDENEREELLVNLVRQTKRVLGI